LLPTIENPEKNPGGAVTGVPDFSNSGSGLAAVGSSRQPSERWLAGNTDVENFVVSWISKDINENQAFLFVSKGLRRFCFDTDSSATTHSEHSILVGYLACQEPFLPP
jgi:hypothetical protein